MQVNLTQLEVKETAVKMDVVKIITLVQEVHFYYSDGSKKIAVSAQDRSFAMTVKSDGVEFSGKLKFMN
jgi:predicted P-loop ATPase/GTPase